MSNIETQPKPTAADDLLIVLGKNIGDGSTQEDIRRSPHHLSPESRLNALAAGRLWTPGTDILFSGGPTAGPDIPAEADAMKKYFMRRYPEIPETNLIIEDESIDTAGNAEEVARLLKSRLYKHIGIVTVGYHLGNSAKLFENYGIPIADQYASDEVVEKIRPLFGSYVRAWKNSDRIKQEHRKERVRSMLLPVDRKGKLLRQITKRSRK